MKHNSRRELCFNSPGCSLWVEEILPKNPTMQRESHSAVAAHMPGILTSGLSTHPTHPIAQSRCTNLVQDGVYRRHHRARDWCCIEHPVGADWTGIPNFARSIGPQALPIGIASKGKTKKRLNRGGRFDRNQHHPSRARARCRSSRPGEPKHATPPNARQVASHRPARLCWPLCTGAESIRTLGDKTWDITKPIVFSFAWTIAEQMTFR